MLHVSFNLVVILTLIVHCDSKHDNLDLEDYDYDILRNLKRNDVRQRFLRKRIRINYNKKKLIIKLNKADNNVVYFDDIPHFEAINNTEIGKKAKRMEKIFRKMLAMKGVTYIYKRDMSWRTWREVQFKKKEIINYRCSSIINGTCRRCPSGGYWMIEDTPPSCNYEVYAMIDKNRLCGSTNSLFKSNNTCPSVIEFSDLSRLCDNPIITDYKITTDFNDTRTNSICGVNDYCEMTTYYRMYQDYIVFRIVNSTNDIIYSKLMKTGQNFVCLSKCGKIDPSTRTATNYNNPVTFDLLPRKEKLKKHNGNKKERSNHNGNKKERSNHNENKKERSNHNGNKKERNKKNVKRPNKRKDGTVELEAHIFRKNGEKNE